MSHIKPTQSNTDLKREIARLKLQITYWKRRVAEIEAKIGATLPVLTLSFKQKPVHLIVHAGAALAQAADVIEFVANMPPPYVKERNRGHVARLHRIGLGAREAVGLKSDELAERFGTTRMHLCHALGRSAKTSHLGFVTAAGIDALRDRAPEFCSWIEREAFPEVIKRFGKGGAS